MATFDDLLSVLQGASNSAASNLSGPVDAINWALGKAGLPVSKKPIGGSEWLREIGFTAEPKNKNLGLLGEAIGGVLPIAATAKAPQIAAGMNRMGDNLAAPRTLNPQTGAIVWHGSPHKFNKFDSSKIGTGEGAQAYGHGLYLAESPTVADAYRQQLATNVEINGKPFYDGYAGKKVGSTGLGEVDDYLMATLGDTRKARKMLLSDARSIRKDNPEAAKEYQQVMADLRKVRSGVKATNEGSLYKVDLPDDQIAKMLDWDKPLSQQAPEVQKAIKEFAPKAKPFDIPIEHNPTGAEFYGMLSAPSGFGQGGASEALRNLNIPGIRYLDGGSRGLGDGTSNFVVFPGNEGLLSILERNGQPLP